MRALVLASLALANALHGDVMQRRFHAEPMVQAAELLLQEIQDQDAGLAHEHRTISYTPTLVPRASSVPS